MNRTLAKRPSPPTIPYGRWGRFTPWLLSILPALAEGEDSPGFKMNLPGLRWLARGLPMQLVDAAPAVVGGDGSCGRRAKRPSPPTIPYGRWGRFAPWPLHSPSGASRRRTVYRASYIELHDNVVLNSLLDSEQVVIYRARMRARGRFVSFIRPAKP